MSDLIQRSNEVLSAPLREDLLMMDLKQGRYFGINGVGTRVWELLEQPTTMSDIVSVLVDEYDVTREICAEQLAKFLAELRHRGLVRDAS